MERGSATRRHNQSEILQRQLTDANAPLQQMCDHSANLAEASDALWADHAQFVSELRNTLLRANAEPNVVKQANVMLSKKEADQLNTKFGTGERDYTKLVMSLVGYSNEIRVAAIRGKDPNAMGFAIIDQDLLVFFTIATRKYCSSLHIMVVIFPFIRTTDSVEPTRFIIGPPIRRPCLHVLGSPSQFLAASVLPTASITCS